MRIIYVTSSTPYGGGEAFVVPEIEEVRRQGHEVLIVPMYPRGAVRHADAKPLLKCTVTQPLLSSHIAKGAAKGVVQAPARALRALGWLFRSSSSKPLLKNLVVYPKGLWLGHLARKWGAEHIHAHWASTPTTMALIAGEVSGIPWSFTAHAWDITDWSSTAKTVENKLLDFKVGRACFVRFTSRSGVARARNQKVKALSEAKTHVLYTGVPLTDLRRVSRADEQERVSGLPVVLCPAYLLPFKGHVYLLEAVAMLRQRGVDVELWLAGEGELRDELQRRTRALGLSDRVKFLGQLSHPDLLELYRQDKVDIVALASIDLPGGLSEGLPNALIEAMGYGVPVVSTTTGGIPELLEGGAGSLVAPEDSAGLARAIGELVEDPGLRESQGRAGRKRVEESLDIEKVVSWLVERFKACARV